MHGVFPLKGSKLLYLGRGTEKVSEDSAAFCLVFLYHLNIIYHVHVLLKSKNGKFTYWRLGNKGQINQNNANPPGILQLSAPLDFNLPGFLLWDYFFTSTVYFLFSFDYLTTTLLLLSGIQFISPGLIDFFSFVPGPGFCLQLCSATRSANFGFNIST